MKKLLIVNSDAKESSYGGVAPLMRNMHPYLAEAFDVTYLYPKLKHGSWIPNRVSTFLFFLRKRKVMKQYDFVLSHIPEASFVLSFMKQPFGHIFHGNENPMLVSRFKGAMVMSGVFDWMYKHIDEKAAFRYTIGEIFEGRKKIFNPIIRTAEPIPCEQRKGFVFAGRLEAMKQVDRLITIYSKLSSEIQAQNDFYIAGSGTVEETLKAKAREMGVEDKVHFVGKVPNEKMQAFDSKCRMLLMASTYEGMPTAIAEAMTVGLPVVSTDVGDISCVIKNDKNGFLVPAEFRDEDYIKAICDILEDYDRFANEALKTSVIFDAQKVTQEIVEDIRQLIEK